MLNNNAMPRIEVNETIKRKIEYFPCVKCGSENIEFNDCGYSSFNVAWGKCKDCKNEIVIKPCNWNISKEEIITEWNKANNPKILREKYQEQINQLQKLIDNLPMDNKNYNKLNEADKLAIHEVLFQMDILELEDDYKVEQYYNKLPEDIIKNGIHYGFNDSVVMDEMYVFFDENIE